MNVFSVPDVSMFLRLESWNSIEFQWYSQPSFLKVTWLQDPSLIAFTLKGTNSHGKICKIDRNVEMKRKHPASPKLSPLLYCFLYYFPEISMFRKACAHRLCISISIHEYILKLDIIQFLIESFILTTFVDIYLLF